MCIIVKYINALSFSSRGCLKLMAYFGMVIPGIEVERSILVFVSNFQYAKCSAFYLIAAAKSHN